MTLELGVDELLTTTRSVRRRLDFDKPVPREILAECLELALQAPNAADAQGWRWIFVQDEAKKAALADIYRANLVGQLEIPQPGSSDSSGAEQANRFAVSGQYLVEHLQDAPAMLIPCLQGRVENAPPGLAATFWASLMPATWSFCLALRSRGLGSCWTTLHLLGDGERQAATVLGIPYDQYSQAGLLPIAYTKGTQFKAAKRLPAKQVMSFDGW